MQPCSDAKLIVSRICSRIMRFKFIFFLSCNAIKAYTLTTAFLLFSNSINSSVVVYFDKRSNRKYCSDVIPA